MKQKQLGQFFTPELLSDFMIRLTYSNHITSFLDPAVGKGIFLKSLEKQNPTITKFAYDVDPKMITICQQQSFSVKLLQQDYLLSDSNRLYDLILCNPPYHKFQEIKNRKLLIDRFKKQYKVSLSGYTNLYIYFLIKSINELAPNGKCCYIIPAEFLNAGYGKNVKEYLLKTGMLSKIIRFDNQLNIFEEAITTSCIIVLENKKHTHIEFLNISDMTQLENPLELNCVNKKAYSELNPNVKWLQYFHRNNILPYTNLIPFHQIAQVKRGIATGNNDFFVLKQKDISLHNLTREACIPCACKASDIKKPIFNEDSLRELINDNKKIFLFDGTKANTNFDYEYIHQGEKKGYNKGFLTSHRSPWYSIENKQVFPIWISVFSRNGLKIVRNESLIKNLTTFHGVSFHNSCYTSEDINILFSYLLTPLAQKILYINKREYGNGLDKFEPNDLNDAFILNIQVLSQLDRQKVLTLYDRLNDDDGKQVIRVLNDIFLPYVIPPKFAITNGTAVS